MLLEQFETFLREEKKVAPNTIQAYIKDLQHFETFILSRGVSRFNDVTNTDILAYLMKLKEEGKSGSTVNRKLASIRTFYNYLLREVEVLENPTENIKSPKIEKKEIVYLSIEEIDKLMHLPNNSPKGLRDRAVLEVLYATGIRASELIEMKIDDVNLRMGFIKCSGEHSRARVIPMGRLCRAAMEEYIYESRDLMLKGNINDTVFVNYIGEPMTRQGLWKVLKEYGELAGFDVSLTPQIIRNSFAVHMLQNGADLKSLQELMGHEDIAATQAYLAVTKNRIKDVYDKTHPRA